MAVSTVSRSGAIPTPGKFEELIIMNLSSKFRGCLVGGLLGDCLGAPFEGENRPPRSVLNSYFKRLADPNLKVPYKCYTDDTAMMRCIAQSLVDKKEFDICDITKWFVKEYYASPNRGYGRNVIDVFAALRATKFKDVFAPAAIQFGGSGSYGNGAAMRVAPVSLFCHSYPVDKVVNLSKQSALVTHANRLGYNGAILQCLAIHEVLQQQDEKLNSGQFLETLISRMRKIETYIENEIVEGDKKVEFVYVPALEKVRFLLEKGDDVSVAEVEDNLGNDIAAHLSVPTAIYVFLRAQSPIPGVEAENYFQRTVHYAISLGGDTDTIAAMAGNIAGAYYGLDGIPIFLRNHCEDYKNIVELAENLYKVWSQLGHSDN